MLVTLVANTNNLRSACDLVLATLVYIKSNSCRRARRAPCMRTALHRFSADRSLRPSKSLDIYRCRVKDEHIPADRKSCEGILGELGEDLI